MALDPARVAEARLSLRLQTPPAHSLPGNPPDLDALYKGAGLCWNNAFADVRAWALHVETAGLPATLVALLEPLRDAPTVDDVAAAAECAEACELAGGLPTDILAACYEIGARLRVSGTYMGHLPSACIASAAVAITASSQHDDAVLILQLTSHWEFQEVAHRIVAGTYDARHDADRAVLREAVWADMQRDAGIIEFWRELRRQDARAAGRGPVRDDTGHDPRDEDYGRAERVVADLLDEAEPGADAGVVVFPRAILDGVGKTEVRRDIERALGKSLAVPLRRIAVPEDWNAWERGLTAEAPWLAPLHRAVRAGQGGRSHWDHDAIFVVGPAGAGKSREGGRIAAASGLPTGRYNLDSASDNSLGGTSARWSSGHLSFVESLLARAGTATALCQYDEADKAAGTRNSGGHPYDVLHGLLERETAASWRSIFLLGDVDLGHNVHLLTGNTTDGIPSSLLDRMTVVRVGEPGPEHLGLLAPALARQACRELGLDERWGDLDHEEISALQDAWRGGSVRRLQRLVSRLLQARDHAPVARH